MKRALLVLTAIFSIASTDKKNCDAFVLRMVDVSFANGISATDMNGLFERYGKRFAYFSRSGRRYVIRDAATLNRIEAIYAPQARLGERQGVLGRKQGALGAKQAAMGMEQARIGMAQARGSSPELEGKQRELSQQQKDLGEEQRKLGQIQKDLGEQQNELGRDAERRLQPILEEAVRNRVAVEVR